jgi:hypothetical protein
MHSRCIGWDDRFIYNEQSMWRGEDCTSHVLIRSAIVSKAGIVPPVELARAAGISLESPALPDWVQGLDQGRCDADPGRPSAKPWLAPVGVSGFTCAKQGTGMISAKKRIWGWYLL